MSIGSQNAKVHETTRGSIARGHLAPANPAQGDPVVTRASIEESQQPPTGPDYRPLAGQKTWNVGVNQLETDLMTPGWYSSQGDPHAFPPGCANQNTQSTDAPYDGNPYSEYSIVFTVYNATGYGRNDYFVVVEASGNISAGIVNSNFSYRGGWFNIYNSLAISPCLEGAELLQNGAAAPSPGSWQNPACEVSLTLDMELTALDQPSGSTYDTPFSATFSGSIDLPDWAVSQTTDGNAAAWEFFQIAPWSYTPPWNNPNWHQVFSNGYNDGDINEVSLTATTSMNTYSVAAWKFDQSLVSQNGRLPVRWKVKTDQRVAIVWNVHGWNGTGGFISVGNLPDYSEEIDLVEVVSRGSWEDIEDSG